MHLKIILRISIVFGMRGGGAEILTIIGGKKMLQIYMSIVLCTLIMNIECLVYIHSLDFPLSIHITKIAQFHIS